MFIAVSNTPSMTVIAIAIGLFVGIVFFALGALNLSTCNGALSLGLFGCGMIAVALTSAAIGGVPVGIGTGTLGVILLVVGFLLQNGASCTFGL